MENNDFVATVGKISEILKDNEKEKLKLLRKIAENNQETRVAKKLITNELAGKLIELLPDGFGKKLLQLEAYEFAYLGGSNAMDYQKRGTLLRELIDDSIEIDPDKGSNVYVSKASIYVCNSAFHSIGMDLYGEGLNSLERVVEEINMVLPGCALSVRSVSSSDEPRYQCFTIKFKE